MFLFIGALFSGVMSQHQFSELNSFFYPSFFMGDCVSNDG